MPAKQKRRVAGVNRRRRISLVIGRALIRLDSYIPFSLKLATDNLLLILSGNPLRTSIGQRTGIFSARDRKMQLHYCRKNLFPYLYRRGIQTRVDRLAALYHLHKIPLSEKRGLFIDCGANIGELGYWVRERNFDYLPFEPEELDANCCDLNNFGGEQKTVRKALWKESGPMPLYSKPEDADSSLIEMKGHTAVSTIDALRLDDAVDLDQVEGLVVLKVEAEGAEPEVLQGAGDLLRKIHYVTVDAGPERGKSQEHTIVAVNRVLAVQGFELTEFYQRRICCLYRNLALTTLTSRS